MPEILGGQVLSMVVGAILVCCVLIGANRGLLLGLFCMFKNLIVIAAAVGVAPVIAKRLPETMVAAEGIAYIIALVVSAIIFNIVARLIKEFDEVPGISAIDRLGGAVLGAVVGFFAVWTLLGVLGCFQEYDFCREVVEATRENPFIMWIQTASPLPAILEAIGFPVI